jgi:hypothetical protein
VFDEILKSDKTNRVMQVLGVCFMIGAVLTGVVMLVLSILDFPVLGVEYESNVRLLPLSGVMLFVVVCIGLCVGSVAWFVRKQGLQRTHAFALNRVAFCLVAVLLGACCKAGVYFYQVFGAYRLPPWVLPLIAFLLSDALIYGGLCCLIWLSMRSGRAAKVRRNLDYRQLSDVDDKDSMTAPMIYRV